MALKLSNRASSVLAANIADDTTTIAIQSGDEGLFPSLVAGDWFPVTVVDASGNVEHMRCTARAGVSLTVIRAQEGTTARSFDAGAKVDLRLTAAELVAAIADAGRLTTGTIDRERLGDGLQEVATTSGNLNTHSVTGLYRTLAGAPGAPVSQDGYLLHIESEDGAAYQRWRQGTGAAEYDRLRVSDVWSTWTVLRVGAAAQDAIFFPKTGGTLTGKATTLASATGGAGFALPAGAEPTAPVNGDIWNTGTKLQIRIDGVTQSVVFESRSIGVGGLATGGGDLSSDRTITVPKSTSAQALAGEDDTTAMTPVRVKEKIDATPNKVTTSGDGQLVDFPIGHTIMCSIPGGLNRNNPASPRLNVVDGGGNQFYTTTGSGTPLVGTWRGRGGDGNGAYLLQRVS